jgi:Protein of unknown function (DUF4238)
MKLPKHHYIPVFYLREWVDSKNRLMEFSRPTRKEVKARDTAPTGTGYVRGLYRMTNRVALSHPHRNPLIVRRTTCTELDAGSPSPAAVTADRPQRKPSGDWRRHAGSHGSVKFFWMRGGTNVLLGRPCRQGAGPGRADA